MSSKDAQPNCPCGRPIFSRGLCSTCYKRDRAKGLQPCHCGAPQASRGLCANHYQKYRESADPRLKRKRLDRQIDSRKRRRNKRKPGEPVVLDGNPISRRFRGLKRDCLQRNKELGLSREHFGFYASKDCFYCGGPPPVHCGGLDRIDNEIGYVPGNVVPCCGTCNSIRGRYLSVYETKKLIALVMEWRRTGGKSPWLGLRYGAKKKDK